MGRNRNREDSIEFNNNSLLDIISNVLGIMIFLAVIIVLLPSSTKEKPVKIENITESEHAYLHKRMPVIVDIPWSRMEEYENIVLSIVYEEHIIYIDFEHLYQSLKNEVRDSFTLERDIENLYNVSAVPVRLGDAKNAWFSFSPPPYTEGIKIYKDFDSVLDPLAPARTRLVFFVYSSGHDTFLYYYYKYRSKGFNISWFAMPSPEARHYIGYSFDGIKVQAE